MNCECGYHEVCECEPEEDEEYQPYAWLEDVISDTDDLIDMDEDFYREEE